MSEPESLRKPSDNTKISPDEAQTVGILEPTEEATLLAESNALKTTANNLFTTSSYTEAIVGYNRALETLPSYLDYDLAVLKSNIAACHLKLEEWKEAIESATEALEGLERVDPVPIIPTKDSEDGGKGTTSGKLSRVQEDSKEASSILELDDKMAERLETLDRTNHTISDIKKLRIKSLLRRATARSRLPAWSSLQGSLEDYQSLSAMDLTPLDRKHVSTALRTLPPKLEEAKKTEMADMMGKLKQLGNGILKPFGLSTENFNMIKDEKTGGYSLNFDQGKK